MQNPHKLGFEDKNWMKYKFWKTLKWIASNSRHILRNFLGAKCFKNVLKVVWERSNASKMFIKVLRMSKKSFKMWKILLGSFRRSLKVELFYCCFSNFRLRNLRPFLQMLFGGENIAPYIRTNNSRIFPYHYTLNTNVI